MPSFSYKAINKSGSVSVGEIDAADRGEALRVLDRRGLQPVTLKESGGVAPVAKKKSTTKPSASREAGKGRPDDAPEGPLKLKRQEVVMFTEELSDMLSSGLQLEPALKSMENRQELGNLKVVASRLRQDVRDGTNFSVALKRVSPSFGPLYCSLAAAGEVSGSLDTILKRQAHYLKTLLELQGRLILALIYPTILVLAGIGAAILIVTVLMPAITQLIQSSPGGKIPLSAAIIIGAADFLKKWWIVILLLMAAGGIFFKTWKDNEENKPKWDAIKLRLPLVGRVMSSRFYVQFLETMANLVSNGMPLLRSLELTRDATQNLSIRAGLTKMIELVGDGRALSNAMMRVGTFPPLLIDMVSVGEQTGKIDQSLRRAAERYDKELNKDIQRIMALVSPIILVGMAVLIGSIMYLIFTSIFQTLKTMGA